MASSTFLQVIFCLITAICMTALDDLPPGNLELMRHPTQDITVMCDLAAFMDSHQSFNIIYLQVMRTGVSGRTDPLATLDMVKGDVSASDHLTLPSGPLYVLKGEKDKNAMRNSFLNLSLANIHGDTSFYCQVNYSDAGHMKHWRSEAFPFSTNTEPHPGIAVTVTEGLSLRCYYRPQGAVVNETSIEIAKIDSEGASNLCQQHGQHLRLCKFRNALDGVLAIKQVHLFNPACAIEGEYLCSLSATPKEESEKIPVYLSGCPTRAYTTDRTTTTTTSTSPTTTEVISANATMNCTSPPPPDHSEDSLLVSLWAFLNQCVPLWALLVLAAVTLTETIAFVIFCRCSSVKANAQLEEVNQPPAHVMSLLPR